MGAGGLPGEADGWTIFKMVGCWDRIEGPETEEPTRVVSLADPASALRAVLREPEAREELRRLLTSEAVLKAAKAAVDASRSYALGHPSRRAIYVEAADEAYDVLSAAVDALASGVEGERDA